jgi:hypothetical protein
MKHEYSILESTDTGYSYAYGTPWVCTDGVSIFLFFILQRVRTWYSCGTRIQKNAFT